MSARRDITSYPKEVVTTFAKVIGRSADKPLCINFKTPAKAKSARRTFYAFRESLYQSPYTYPQLTLIAPLIAFRLTDTILSLYIEPISKGDENGKERAS